MDIISYRGPGVAGGVSSGLASVWRSEGKQNSRWWYLNDGVLEMLNSANGNKGKFISLLPESLIDGHYRFCNEFLWPIMHDLAEFATYSQEQHDHYRTFNRMVSEQIDVESPGKQEFFIQDYQLGLAPRWLALHGHKTVVFWHIPWPKKVPDCFKDQICELASGLLGASVLGFHTDEYARNFMQFVSDNLPDYKINKSQMTIENKDQSWFAGMSNFIRASHKSYVLHQDSPARIQRNTGSCTSLVVHPLGVDLDYWSALREDSRKLHEAKLLEICKFPFILSVDRVDYTKSVLDRLQIIDKFFEQCPQWVGRLQFVQVCGRSRKGLPAFDRYFEDCRRLHEQVNQKWCSADWQPVNWVQSHLASQELAYLYLHAEAMLVNPVRDGLNLTAKEFVACQDENAGVLLLSPGAGASYELGDFALSAPPRQHSDTISSILRALNMPRRERQLRIIKMKTLLASNQLADWWARFCSKREVLRAHTLHRGASPLVEESYKPLKAKGLG